MRRNSRSLAGRLAACAGKILKRDAAAARQMPGIKAVCWPRTFPGRNDVGAVKQDEILLADKEVCFMAIWWRWLSAIRRKRVARRREGGCGIRVAAPVLTLRDAIAKNSFHNEPNFIRRGDAEKNLADAPLML